MARLTLSQAAEVAKVDRATIRQWVRRGHITRYPDGYDGDELLDWIDSRDQRMASLASKRLESERRVVAD